MELNLDFLRPQERLSLQLRQLYEGAGFRHYHMSRFEEYGLYQQNRRFLSDEQVLSFTDLDGRLMALKPDVTLSIAKTPRWSRGAAAGSTIWKMCTVPVRRAIPSRRSARWAWSASAALEEGTAAQVVSLAVSSLALTERDFVLELSHMGFVSGLMDAVGAPEGVRPQLLRCIRDKNRHELRRCAARRASPPRGRRRCAGSGP